MYKIHTTDGMHEFTFTGREKSEPASSSHHARQCILQPLRMSIFARDFQRKKCIWNALFNCLIDASRRWWEWDLDWNGKKAFPLSIRMFVGGSTVMMFVCLCILRWMTAFRGRSFCWSREESAKRGHKYAATTLPAAQLSLGVQLRKSHCTRKLLGTSALACNFINV